MNGAGAKHGTINSSNIARVTGSDASAGARLLEATAMEEGGGTGKVACLVTTLAL